MNILCLSRSYLSRLLPTIEQRDRNAHYFHIVQSNAEAAAIRKDGGTVVLNIEQLIRDGLKKRSQATWDEPSDFRNVTGFMWSPIYADRYLPEFEPQLRGRIAGLLDDGIRRLFDEYRFDVFLSEPIALFITQLLYYHCRKHDVRPLLWANAFFPGHFYFADQVDISTPVRRAPAPPAWDEEVRRRVEAYAHGVVEDRAGPVNHHAFAKAAPSLLTYFRQRRGKASLVLQPGLWTRLLQAGRLARAGAIRAVFPYRGDFLTAGSVAEHSFYLRTLGTDASLYDPMPNEDDGRAVVFPLQFEPEASLLYLAPAFVNQQALVEACLRSLPAGHILYVKEHPNQFGALGEPLWRALRKRYDNVRFIHGRQSGRALIRRSALVVVISSTAGMDALLLGRRALVAGRVFYDRFTGATPIRSYDELARHLNDPASYRPTDSFAANIAELSEFGRHCYPGDPQPAKGLFSEENLENLCQAISAEARHDGSGSSGARL